MVVRGFFLYRAKRSLEMSPRQALLDLGLLLMQPVHRLIQIVFADIDQRHLLLQGAQRGPLVQPARRC